MSAHGWRRFHLTGIVVWLLLAIPTIFWWRDSILWVAMMSVYALVMAHFTAWQATRAEEEAAHTE